MGKASLPFISVGSSYSKCITGSKHRLNEVFGVSRGIPLTYIPRDSVDTKFLASLSRDKHVVVYGSSKQGKTCLRKKNLHANDYIVVQCGNTSTRGALYEMLLKEAGASVSSKDTRTLGGSLKADVHFATESGIPLLAKGKADASGGGNISKEAKLETVSFEIDPEDPNDVIRVLTEVKFSKFIVLEDFHYLSEEVQKQVAIDLKAFHERSSLCFIIVGVWLESNRLVLYNGDLAGRLIPIDVDQWSDENFRSVISSGEGLLNIKFTEEVKERLIKLCRGNVGILQEACHRMLELKGVFETRNQQFAFDDISLVEKTVRELASEQASRYRNFLTRFVEGFRETELDIWRWIAAVIVTTSPEDLKRGLKFQFVFKRLNEIHPIRAGTLHANNVFQAIQNIRTLQHKNKVQPIIFDFDSNENTLQIVDAGFILYVASVGADAILDTIMIRRTDVNEATLFDALEGSLIQ